MKYKILRQDGAALENRYEVFDVETTAGMTVLGALFYIQDRLDDSLAFRHSCRGAVCGTCAMLINNVPRLACRTQVNSLLDEKDPPFLRPYSSITRDKPWDKREEVLVEPLPHLPVIRDLVVDMAAFFQHYRAIEPIFRPADEDPSRERRMDPAAVRELAKYTNCILCALCHGGCPVSAKKPEYLGPAALAKLYRFHLDPREALDNSRLKLANTMAGWWSCEFHGNCMRVCPKGVPPTLAIAQARQDIQKAGQEPDEYKERIREDGKG